MTYNRSMNNSSAISIDAASPSGNTFWTSKSAEAKMPFWQSMIKKRTRFFTDAILTEQEPVAVKEEENSNFDCMLYFWNPGSIEFNLLMFSLLFLPVPIAAFNLDVGRAMASILGPIFVIYHVFKATFYAISASICMMAIYRTFDLIEFKSLKGGLIGEDNIYPWEVLIAFCTLAYLCLSIETTGVLSDFASAVAGLGGDSPTVMFFLVFLTASVLTIFTSNDAVILLTPIVSHICRSKGLNPEPFYYGQFMAANVWSMFTIYGNPTNMIASKAMGDLEYFEYIKLMCIPTFVTSIACCLCVYLYFRKDFHKQADAPTRLLSRSKRSVNAGRSIGSGNSLMIKHSWMSFRSDRKSIEFEITDAEAPGRRWVYLARLLICLVLMVSSKSMKSDVLDDWFFCVCILGVCIIMDGVWDYYDRSTGGSANVLGFALENVPWFLFIFVPSVFSCIDVMRDTSIIDNIAKFLHDTCEEESVCNVFFFTSLTVIFCQCFTNLGATVIFSRILNSNTYSNLKNNPKLQKLLWGCVIYGTNVGGTVTLLGSLAGILWQSFVQKMAEEGGAQPITYFSFLNVSIHVAPFFIIVGAVGVWFAVEIVDA